MHYEYRVVINATNGNEQRTFTYLSKDGKPITDYKDALAIREKMTQSIDAQGFSPLSTVIQSRRVEDWGRTTYPASLGLDTGKLINDNQLMAQRLDAIEAQCARERAMQLRDLAAEIRGEEEVTRQFEAAHGKGGTK